MTDAHDAVFAGTPTEGEGNAAGTGSPGRPLPILLFVTLGGSAVLLFAMASGHLKGTEATLGVLAALVQAVLAVGALMRPSRDLFAAAAIVNVAVAVFWLAVEGPHTVSALTAGIGVALSALAVLVGTALTVRPDSEQLVVSDIGVRFTRSRRRGRDDNRRAVRHVRRAGRRERGRPGTGPRRGRGQAGSLVDRHGSG